MFLAVFLFWGIKCDTNGLIGLMFIVYVSLKSSTSLPADPLRHVHSQQSYVADLHELYHLAHSLCWCSYFLSCNHS